MLFLSIFRLIRWVLELTISILPIKLILIMSNGNRVMDVANYKIDSVDLVGALIILFIGIWLLLLTDKKIILRQANSHSPGGTGLLRWDLSNTLSVNESKRIEVYFYVQMAVFYLFLIYYFWSGSVLAISSVLLLVIVYTNTSFVNKQVLLISPVYGEMIVDYFLTGTGFEIIPPIILFFITRKLSQLEFPIQKKSYIKKTIKTESKNLFTSRKICSNCNTPLLLIIGRVDHVIFKCDKCRLVYHYFFKKSKFNEFKFLLDSEQQNYKLLQQESGLKNGVALTLCENGLVNKNKRGIAFILNEKYIKKIESSEMVLHRVDTIENRLSTILENKTKPFLVSSIVNVTNLYVTGELENKILSFLEVKGIKITYIYQYILTAPFTINNNNHEYPLIDRQPVVDLSIFVEKQQNQEVRSLITKINNCYFDSNSSSVVSFIYSYIELEKILINESNNQGDFAQFKR